MKRVLITGCTGFVGSALAASFLAADHEVVALSRRDPDGARTRAAIDDAAAGFSLELTPGARRRLRVHDVDFTRGEAALTAELFAGVEAVWHCAAEMSFSPHGLAASAHQNITVTACLHRALTQHGATGARFHHLSTAFTAGNEGGRVWEELHAAPILVNAYQLTKWGAEQTLAHLSRQGAPVTLVRTTGVVGHLESGWSRSKSFGLYLFVDAVARVRAGASALRLDLRQGARPNLVPIDTVVDVCRRLGARRGTGPGLEVFHCVGEAVLTTGEILVATGDLVGVDVRFAPPETPLDATVNTALQPVRPFVEIHWDWDASALVEALGGFVPPPVDDGRLRRLVRAHLQRLLPRRGAGQRTTVDSSPWDVGSSPCAARRC